MKLQLDSRRRGLSLLGVLLGVTAVSFLLLPLFLHFQTARTGARRNAHSLTASALATAQIEKLKRLTFRRLETILLTQGNIESVESDSIQWPNVLSGPFEAPRELPDIVEPVASQEGPLTYQRHTYLSYFPKPNPDPDSPSFDQMRRRIRVRVVILWEERLGVKGRTPRSFEMSTMVHDEGFNPKPSLRTIATP